MVPLLLKGDIEILADDACDEHGTGSTGAAEKQATTQPAVPGRSSEAHSRRVESRTVAEPHDGWEPSHDDLDLNVFEGSRSGRVALPVVHSRDRDGTVPPAEADEQPETEFSLSRSATRKIEELDLAPMVNVAFQLVPFLHGDRHHGTVQDAGNTQTFRRGPRRCGRPGPLALAR